MSATTATRPAATRKLHKLGVTTAAGLRDLDVSVARKLLTIVGARIALELRGTSCLPLDLVPKTQQNMAVTWTFGNRRPRDTLGAADKHRI